MFRIDVLPASHGDCLWITYGSSSSPHRMLIDGGPEQGDDMVLTELQRRLSAIGAKHALELLVVTHIDADHIDGIVRLFRGTELPERCREIWFNAYKQLPKEGVLGAVAGEDLTGTLQRNRDRWNTSFERKAAVVPDGEKPLPVIKLPGGMTLTLLSPSIAKLRKLAPVWERECKKAKLIPGKGQRKGKPDPGVLGKRTIEQLVKMKFQRDSAPANGSSIAFIAEYDRKRALFGADAHPDVLVESLKRLGAGPHRFNAVKVAHHGSRRNSSPELLDLIQSPKWLISTNGAVFEHPDDEAIARIIVSQRKPQLVFNYKTRFNQRWSDSPDPSRFTTRYGNAKGISVSL
jgi:beta-lactamase superfamily II metal-dependent hydrolase